MLPLRAAAILTLVMALGCGDEPAELEVRLLTPYLPGIDFASVGVFLSGPGMDRSANHIAATGTTYALSPGIVVAEFVDVADLTNYTLSLSLVAPSGSTFRTETLAVQVDGFTSVTVPISAEMMLDATVPPPTDAGTDALVPMPIDTGPIACPTPCGPASQCGCVAGQMCSLRDNAVDSICLPAGSIPNGGSCERHSQCAAGNACAVGLCRTYCDSSLDCGGGGCLAMTFGGTFAQVGVCTEPCDPVGQTGCPSGFHCKILPIQLHPERTMVSMTLCLAGGANGALQSCSDTSECGANLVCVNAACNAPCNLAAPACGGLTCTDVGLSTIRGTTYGFCR